MLRAKCYSVVLKPIDVNEDDGIILAEKVKKAAALVMGGFTPYSSLDSRTKAFIERPYPLRHTHGFLRGKPGGAVIPFSVPSRHEQLPSACNMGINGVTFYMMEEGINFLRSEKISGNVPCVNCGQGEKCKMPGIKMLYGSEATVNSIGINTFEQRRMR